MIVKTVFPYKCNIYRHIFYELYKIPVFLKQIELLAMTIPMIVLGRQITCYPPIHSSKLKLKKNKKFHSLASCPSPQQDSWPERNFSIASDFPAVHLRSLSFDIKSQCCFCPPCSWRSRFRPVHSLRCLPFSTHVLPQDLALQTALPQGRQPG